MKLRLRGSLTFWILVSMVVGALFGYAAPHEAAHVQVLSQIFLRLIKVIIAPLLFATLVSGIARHSDLKQLGRMGLKSIIYFELVTTAALFIGLAAINISRAGEGMHAPVAANSAAPAASAGTSGLSGAQVVLNAFPENIAKAVAEGQVLQVVVFSILFAIALALVPGAKRAPVLNFCESLTEVMFRFTNLIMLYAPIGVGAAIAYAVSQSGLNVLGNLAKLVGTFYVALAVFILLVLLPVAFLARVPIKRFVKAVAEPVSIAFGTASSEAALPRAMEAMEAIGVPRQVAAFVIPLGYSFNLDGSTLYLSLAAIFVAQVAGIHLTFHQQLAIMLTLLLASKGVAGVPKGSYVVLLATVDSVGLPSSVVLLLLAVDQIMDMVRTATNVLGNCLASVIVARWEHVFETETESPAALEATTP